MTLDVQWILTAAALATALITLCGLAYKVFKWIEHQKEQDAEIEKLKSEFKETAAEIRNMHKCDTGSIQEEQALAIYGLLACLKGLKERGCNGPVTEAIDRLEKHLNKKAHNQD